MAGHMPRIIGLIGAARGDDPAQVEAEPRAGTDALDRFGAVGLRARAEHELAHWFPNQDRVAEAHALLEQAGITYREIGATGWLTPLDRPQDPVRESHRQARRHVVRPMSRVTILASDLSAPS
jgi:hypothetical protein